MRNATTVLVLLLVTLAASAGEPAKETGPSDRLARADQAFAAKDWRTAAGLYREIVETNDGNARAWFRLGFALHAAGDYEGAIAAHRRAATFPRIRPVALYNLACAQCLAGDPDGAFATLETAVSAGFRAPKRLSADPDLKALANRDGFAALEERALPPKLRSVYRQFDFWIGKWAVTGRSGQLVGTNLITKGEGGFLLTEKWTNSQGATGTSVNFHDPADGLWHQVWVDPTGNVTRYSGSWKGGAMRFTGVSCSADGRKEPRRMTFTPRPDGTVRQLIEKSSDGGKTWTVDFDGIYTPAK